jgi:hypothetical protein
LRERVRVGGNLPGTARFFWFVDAVPVAPFHLPPARGERVVSMRMNVMMVVMM